MDFRTPHAMPHFVPISPDETLLMQERAQKRSLLDDVGTALGDVGSLNVPALLGELIVLAMCYPLSSRVRSITAFPRHVPFDALFPPSQLYFFRHFPA